METVKVEGGGGDVSVQVAVEMPFDIRSISSPTHQLRIKVNVSTQHCFNWFNMNLGSSAAGAPFSSNRQHLSYDGCLEVRREIIRTVLCCSVY